MRNEIQTKLFIENFEKVCKELFSYFHSDLFTKIDLKAEQNYFNPNEEQKRMAQMNIIISRKSGQKIQKIANLQYYKSKANYGTKKKGISR